MVNIHSLEKRHESHQRIFVRSPRRMGQMGAGVSLPHGHKMRRIGVGRSDQE